MAQTPMQGFTKAVERRAQEEAKPEVIGFYLETTIDGETEEDGSPVVYRYDEFHAARPTEEQMMMLLANGARRDATLADEVASIFDLFRSILPAGEFRIMERRFMDEKDEGVSYDTLGQIMEWLMAQWQDFPTQQPAASSGSRANSGTRSTGRVRGKGSIPSTSR